MQCLENELGKRTHNRHRFPPKTTSERLSVVCKNANLKGIRVCSILLVFQKK
jgi:hypothetical protein